MIVSGRFRSTMQGAALDLLPLTIVATRFVFTPGCPDLSDYWEEQPQRPRAAFNFGPTEGEICKHPICAWGSPESGRSRCSALVLNLCASSVLRRRTGLFPSHWFLSARSLSSYDALPSMDRSMSNPSLVLGFFSLTGRSTPSSGPSRRVEQH